ncbi:hypothetical protein BO71DRAFT_336231 [Aspergillus ellipticus CBS 707.79]|uniref:BZIP domain-containing protein n=1 Tax=Aspergillus ellipticus CBS 707.79 TaxID=1448320 RepID=A0A319D544_9EURO|nr:hypothetical protein BO71DRAFT_336231 [Aspergillus ellipticus CBS 707.79]
MYGGYGGIQIANLVEEQHIVPVEQLAPLELPTQKRRSTQEHNHETGTAAAPKKRGRPRKNENALTGERPEERRRAQIRLAQRAYRDRKEAALSKHEARIAELETAMKKMNATVFAFGDHLARSGVMTSHPNLRTYLHDTLQTCKSLIDKVCVSDDEDNNTTTTTTTKPSQLPTPPHAHRAPSPRTYLTLSNRPATPLSPDSPMLFNNASMTIVDITSFMTQLRIACVAHAYHLLRNPSVKPADLHTKFRFLLSIISREELTAYFETMINSGTDPFRIEYDGIPFFRVGGAGTHYLPYPSPPEPSELYNYQNEIRNDPLAVFPVDVQDQFEGRWFDLNDLEGFLQEQGVSLLAHPPALSDGGFFKLGSIDPSALIRILVNMCICLGRSPGWKRADVEQAVKLALWQ